MLNDDFNSGAGLHTATNLIITVYFWFISRWGGAIEETDYPTMGCVL